MAAQQRLLSFWVLMLLITALCPGSLSKRGGSVKGRGKSDGDQASSSQSRGLSKKGLKGAGAAVAGMLGGSGYRLGFIGKPKHGTGNHHSHKTEQHQQPAYQETQRYNNQSLWRAFVRGSAPATGRNFLLTLGHGVPFLTTAWIRDV